MDDTIGAENDVPDEILHLDFLLKSRTTTLSPSATTNTLSFF